MFTSKFSCTVICTRCTTVESKFVQLGPMPISDMAQEITEQVAPECRTCKSKNLKIRDIELKPLADKVGLINHYDEFGHDHRGVWYCPKGHYKQYYPASIRRAFEDGFAGYPTDYQNKYTGMEKLGYPPRCNKCKTKLLYLEQESHNQFTCFPD